MAGKHSDILSDVISLSLIRFVHMSGVSYEIVLRWH